MPKNIKPVMGQTAVDFLAQAIDKFKQDSWQPDSCDQARHMFSSLSDDVVTCLIDVKDYVNPEVCLNEDQSRLLMADLELWRNRMIELGINDRNVAADQLVHSATIMINSFRLDCENCLAKDCGRRDTNFPLRAVERRLKLFVNSEGPAEISIHDLIGNRAISNLLARSGIKTAPDLSNYTEEDLLSIPRFGYRSLRTLKKAISKHHGVSLKQSTDSSSDPSPITLRSGR